MLSAKKIIEILNLKPHPEGGYFKENYRSKGVIKNNSLNFEANGERNYSTSIYFLLNENDFSAFHKIRQDEIWHFYAGSTLLLHTINPNGNYNLIRIGNKLENEDFFQFVVPARTWFASEVENKTSYSFCGCTVSPGFDFRDFEMPSAKTLSKIFPQHQEIIKRLSNN